MKRKNKPVTKSSLDLKPSTKTISKSKQGLQERTFSEWLSSDEGIENLKLFVIGNTLVCLMLVVWPQVKEALDAVYYMYMDYKLRE